MSLRQVGSEDPSPACSEWWCAACLVLVACGTENNCRHGGWCFAVALGRVCASPAIVLGGPEGASRGQGGVAAACGLVGSARVRRGSGGPAPCPVRAAPCGGTARGSCAVRAPRVA